MSTASESTLPTPVGRVPIVSNPFDPTPPSERGFAVVPHARQCLEGTRCPRPQAQAQEIYDAATPRLLPPVPKDYAANYAAFSTAFLSPVKIQDHWDDTPVLVNDFNSDTEPEYQFLDAVRRVSVDDHFKTRIIAATVIDVGLGNSESQYKFFATYSHLMDDKNAYIRIVAYNQDGFRCPSSHPQFGNFILVIPRELNDVVFPTQLRFHAKHVTDPCHNPDSAHNRIRQSAQQAFTALENAWWDSARCAICDTDL